MGKTLGETIHFFNKYTDFDLNISVDGNKESSFESDSKKPFFERHLWEKLGNVNINWIAIGVKELAVKLFLGMIMVLWL